MTIQEIAKLSGVSPATVSRVFSHHPGIRPDVREHVLAVARRYDYHPRVSGKQKNVVIITPYNAVYPVQSCVDMLLMALTQTLPARGFRLEILPLNNLERLSSIQFCAAVAIGVDPDEFSDWPERFAVPLVIVDRNSDKRRENVFYVNSDEAGGMELAIAHLAARGCRRVGCLIHGEAGHGNADVRRAAIVRALIRHGLPADDRLVVFAGNGSERYVEWIGKMLKLGVDALFCPGGNAGIVALYAFSLYNRRVPEDLSLIASEQTFFSQYAVPPQTTITQDYAAVGEAVAALIEAWLDNRLPSEKTTLQYRLIERESVRQTPPVN